VKAREDDARKLHVALDSSDFHILERLGHKIKGSAGTYGFEKTAELAGESRARGAHSRLGYLRGVVEKHGSLIFQGVSVRVFLLRRAWRFLL